MTGPTANMALETVQVGEHTLTLRDLGPDDRDAVLALHTLVFGPEVDAPWFAWKYGQAAGQGQGQALGVWRGSELIAFCGGLPRAIWRQGRSMRGLQMGDVMVHPAWRGILTRRGPFFHVTRSFHSSRLGSPASRPFQLGFGFPNDRHLRLGVMLGLVRDAGVIEALHWNTLQTTRARLPWHWRWEALSPADPRFEHEVNAAWKAMRAQARGLALGQRDASYLRWRYALRPHAAGTQASVPARYCFFSMRRPWSRTCSGVAVLDLRSSSAQWLDWIGPVALMPLASQACRMEAARAGAAELTAWASPAVVQRLVDTDIARREVCAGLAVSAASDLTPQDSSRLQWWLMGGDTDFL